MMRLIKMLDHRRAPVIAALLVPLLFGLLSVCLGQDDNWDLRNYHWYNPHALLNGRLEADMAPAQWQSYFNPLIDVPYYLLATAFPGPAVGFVMGLMHGLNFVLLVAIARQVLGNGIAPARLPLLLAAAGVCGAGFLSELGNTMGDNMTALLVLSSLYLVLRGWNHLGAWSPRTASILLLSGLVMGLGTGLKLTNATYALALCVALLVPPLPWRMRFTNAILYGSAVAAGVFASAGYWWLTMWERFGNPLFPQFNDIFRSPLALQAGVLDSSHVPRNAWEALFWPFIFTVDVKRVSEIALKQAILPALYLLAIVFAFVWLAERLSARQAPARLSPRARFLLVFGLVAYAAWLKLFGIYRYLVPLELLAPLMVWVLVERMAAPAHAAHIGAWIVALATLAVFPFATWGHGGWAAANFSARVPPIARPASTIVFIAHNHPPMGWLATFFPRGVRVISVGSGFPESPAYLERIRAAIAGRPGPHYVMLAAATNDRESGLRRKQAIARALGMTDDAESCGRLDRLLRRVRFQVQVKPVKPAFEAGHRCTLELQSQYVVDLAAQDQAIIRAGQENLARYGLKLDAASCRQYPAAVGTEPHPYHLCVVRP